MKQRPLFQSLEGPPPSRVVRLLNRWPPTGRERTWYPNGADERAILLWRYFIRSEGEPIALRRARGLAYVLDEIDIAIHDDELIVWFVHLGIKMDDGGVGHSFGRFDRYLYPFYRADLEAGRLTVDQMRELLALFWIKLNRECDDIAHLSLGGQTPQGEDATNELSLLCLQVDRWVSRKQPNLSTRVHARTPDFYWREIARTMRRGAGHPAIFSDEVIIPGLLDYGLPVEIVRDYAQVGWRRNLSARPGRSVDRLLSQPGQVFGAGAERWLLPVEQRATGPCYGGPPASLASLPTCLRRTNARWNTPSMRCWPPRTPTMPSSAITLPSR